MRRLFVGLSLFVISWAQSSFAAEAKTEDEYSYTFEDDPLGALDHRDYQTPIKVRKPRGRSTLIRPRYHFIRELEKSVEVL